MGITLDVILSEAKNLGEVGRKKKEWLKMDGVSIIGF